MKPFSFNRIFNVLLAFIPVAILADFLKFSPVIIFFLCACAIIPLAKFIGEATEELATRTNPALGGFLNATFGNATELIIGVFALNAGLIEIVKASITGSIISNLLFVLGFSMLAGGMKHTKQEFNRTAVVASGATLLLAIIAMIIPAIFFDSAPGIGSDVIENLSIWVCAVLLIVYASSLFFTMYTHKHLYIEEVGHFEPKWSISFSLGVLLVCMLLVAWVSEILVQTITPLVASLGWSQLFIGVIFVALIGNASEHVSAVTTAMKNRMDLSLNIAIGSATQIALFVAPILVFVSLAIGHPMSLVFNSFELIAMVLSVIIANFVVADGESNWLEGLQLVAAYAIMAIAFFLHP
jgi:Ca2+:H+ antiporter